MLAQTPDQRFQRDQLSRDIDKGATLAWARHITGLNQDDEFESVAVIPGSGGQDEVWVVVNRTIDGNDFKFVEQFQPQDFGDQNDAYFVDAGIQGGTSNGVAEQASTLVPATYKFTYISGVVGEVWGIPLGDVALNWTFAAGAVIDEGGGIVSLPSNGHPFTAGETIVIHNTTNYEGSHTVHANTTSTRIHFTDTFVSETLTGGETGVKHIDGLDNGESYLVRTADGTMYYGHDRKGSSPNIYFITRIDTDGTTSTSDNWLDEVFGTSTSQCRGLALSPDDAFLYMWRNIDVVTDVGVMYKFNLSTGATEWVDNVADWAQFDMALDADGNTYGSSLNSQDYNKYDEDGTRTTMPDHHGVYNTIVDNTMGVLIGAGTGVTVNFWVTLLSDHSVFDTVKVGTSNISRKTVTSDGTNIFIANVDTAQANQWQFYKYSWNGTSLNLELQADAGDHVVGIFIDLWDNVVVVRADWVTPQLDAFHYYDKNFNLLGVAEDMVEMLDAWDSPSGGAHFSGGIVFDGALASGGDVVFGTDPNFVAVDHFPADVNMCVYADGVPIGNFVSETDPNGTVVLNLGAEYNTIQAGINYYSVYESYLLAPKNTMIKDITLDFFETLGAHVGVDQTFSTDLKFSFDNFATRQEMVTDWKYSPWVRGMTFDPRLYLWEWEPVPMSLRGASIQMEITNE